VIKFNRLIFTFLTIVFSVVFFVLQLVQTELFSKRVLLPLVNKFSKEVNVEINFSNLEIGFFPPSTSFMGVRINQTNLNKLLFDELKIELIAHRFILNDLHFINIKMKGGEIFVKSSDSEPLDIKNMKDVFREKDNLQKYLRKFGIAGVEARDVNFIEKNNRIYIDELSAAISRNNVNLITSARSIKYGEIDVDQIQVGLSANANEISIDDVTIRSDFDSLKFSGAINRAEKNFRGNLSLDLALSSLGKYDTKLGGISGSAQVSIPIEVDPFDPQKIFKKNISDINIGIENLAYQDKKFKKVVGKFSIQNSIIVAEKTTVESETGKLELLNSAPLFEINERRLVPIEIKFAATNFEIGTILSLIEKSLGILRAKVTARGVFVLKPSLEFEVRLDKGGRVRELGLGSQNNPILDIESFEINNLSVGNWLKKVDYVSFDYDLDFPTGRVRGIGEIGNKNVNFKSNFENFNLEEIGKISGVQLLGKADLKLNVQGPFDDVSMSFIGNAYGFEVVGLHLGDLDLALDLHLNQPKLKILSAAGNYQSVKYGGSGVLDFTEKGGPDLKIKISEGKIEDALNMFMGTTSAEKVIKETFTGNLEGTVNIDGKFDSNNLNVYGTSKVPRLFVHDELFENGSLKYSFRNKTLTLENLNFRKNNGNLQGSFLYDLNSTYMEYSAEIREIKLTDFYYYRILNLGLEAEIEGDFFGSGTIEDLTTKNSMRLTNSKIGEMKYRDTTFDIYSNGKEINFNANLSENLLVLQSLINLNEKKQGRSKVFLKVRSNDIKDFLGFVSIHNSNDPDLKGDIDLELSSDFSLFNIENLDLELSLNKFNIKKDDFHLRTQSAQKISVHNGLLRNWNLQLEGKNHFFKSTGVGSVKSGFRIVNSFNFPVELLEVITPSITKASGDIKGLAVFRTVNDKFYSTFDLGLEKFSLKTSFAPISLENGEASINVSGNEILIQKFSGSLGKGKVSANGKLKLLFPYPELDIRATIDKTLLPVFKQSSMVFSGGLSISGNEPPYNVKSNIFLVKGEIRDELNFIRESLASEKKVYKVTQGNAAKKKKAINYNVNLNFDSPLLVKNQLMEFYLWGPTTIWGVDEDFSLQSKIEIVPQTSKVFFKGHEFVITKGIIEFDKVNGAKNPLLSISANTKISGYSIIFDGDGFLDKFSVNFRSEPTLPQEDILSLLTIGVTSQVSKNLQSSDLEAVTSMSVGSVLLDQFGINENLNKSVGLKLSVLPELDQSRTNPIQGRSGTSDLTSSRMRSATKIRLQKKIKEFDFSFSSTFGGSLQQKQEMNINYNLTQDVSVQGVYELYSTDSTNNRTNPDSAGVDLIWKRSFK